MNVVRRAMDSRRRPTLHVPYCKLLAPQCSEAQTRSHETRPSFEKVLHERSNPALTGVDIKRVESCGVPHIVRAPGPRVYNSKGLLRSILPGPAKASRCERRVSDRTKGCIRASIQARHYLPHFSSSTMRIDSERPRQSDRRCIRSSSTRGSTARGLGLEVTSTQGGSEIALGENGRTEREAHAGT